MVCLQANEDEMLSMAESLNGKSVGFYDDDLGFLTAFAFKPMSKVDGDRWFKNFRLA